MTAFEILTDLREAGAIVTIAGDKLRLEVPKGVLTGELKQRLATHKAEIIGLLESETTTNGHVRPRCYQCSKFGSIGTNAGCSKPADGRVSMAALIECSDFIVKTIH